MPSYAYFEELTTAVLMDADEVKGFLKQKSPEEIQELVERMHERIVETFTKLLEVEMEKGGKLQDWQDRVERVREATQAAAGEANLAQAMAEMETFAQQAIPDYDAFLLKAGLRIRKAFVGTLTK
jgi:acyl-CoA reductase-like NAD-dependent aldehyde dehydrogenase